MSAINIHEAKTHFSKLVDRAHAGEEIIIAKAGKPWARLVRIEEEPKPSGRRGAGRVWATSLIRSGSIRFPMTNSTPGKANILVTTTA